MRKSFILFMAIILILFIGCNSANQAVIIETELGNISIELYEQKAPITVANFLNYVDKGMFDNGEFYRVVTLNNQPENKVIIEVIQGGLGWDDDIPRLDSIDHETTMQTGIRHLDGTISMARNVPGSASSEFFICVGKQPELDYGGKRNPDGLDFAAFGKVIHGMDVVHKIHQLPNEDQFLKPTAKIISVSKK